MSCSYSALAAVLLLLLAGTAASLMPPGDDWEGWRQRNREDRYNHWLSHIQFGIVPNFTTVGFELVKAPPETFELLRTMFEEKRSRAFVEAPANVVGNVDQPGMSSDFVADEALNRRVLQDLLPLHEQWAGVPLEPTAAYGLRVYRPGSVLKYHVDRIETHIVSSIFHIARDVDEPWPIHIYNNTGSEHAVDIPPGYMLFYESARLPHFRPTPLKGRFYTSIFLHYKPLDWPFTTALAQSHLPPNWDEGVDPVVHTEL